ncbi:hypothetical protein V1290_006966 [Bradyrhizobium sp. AZCC 1578]|uniref:hypothetical protein n=1 Tax=unclassified Bradyrhizobium TaxID=2631580 RepID=UPI002FEE7227
MADIGSCTNYADIRWGKSLLIFRNQVKPWNQKYSASRQTQITGKTPAIPSRRRGALAIVTNVGTGCGGRGSVGRVDVVAGRLCRERTQRAGRTALKRFRQYFG